MRKPLRSLTPWLLVCATALSGCATPACAPVVIKSPPLPPVPVPLMLPPPKPLQTACRLQSLLFVPATKQTPESVCSALR